MNKLSTIFALILFVAAVCGCNLGSDLNSSGKNSNRRNSKSAAANKKPQKQANREVASDDDESSDDGETAESGETSVEAETISDADSAGDAGDVASLAGKWVWGRSGSTTTTTAGVYVGGNGSRHTYEFADDGAVEYTGIMNIMQAGCTMQIFKTAQGQASLSGERLTIEWEPASFSRKDSCSPSKDYDKTLPAETETFAVELKTSGGDEQLCLTGKDETCYSRDE